MTSPAYLKEIDAMRLLHPNWDGFSEMDRLAKWNIFMHNVSAAAHVGIVNWVENYGNSKEAE